MGASGTSARRLNPRVASAKDDFPSRAPVVAAGCAGLRHLVIERAYAVTSIGRRLREKARRRDFSIIIAISAFAEFVAKRAAQAFGNQ
jgi:hypothetical protein